MIDCIIFDNVYLVALRCTRENVFYPLERIIRCYIGYLNCLRDVKVWIVELDPYLLISTEQGSFSKGITLAKLRDGLLRSYTEVFILISKCSLLRLCYITIAICPDLQVMC